MTAHFFLALVEALEPGGGDPFLPDEGVFPLALVGRLYLGGGPATYTN